MLTVPQFLLWKCNFLNSTVCLRNVGNTLFDYFLWYCLHFRVPVARIIG